MNSAPRPAPGPVSSPARSRVPDFAPVGPRGGRHRLRRVLRRRRRGRRVLAGALAVTAVALAAAAPWGGGEGPDGAPAGAGDARPGTADGPGEPGGEGLVATAVRIADPAAVSLLKPGDEVDVLAAPPRSGGDGPERARVIAHRARVAEVPRPPMEPEEGGISPPGALLVLTVPPGTAADLAGAASAGGLAVARW
ncbi:RcpC/CpaB family pilus assembly protein [Streptomyces sp. 6N223]|uniref:RcpC/CpaB family pilus assembly protein n=1 Tax=Streptomyces sp. 6N223 TaxID=3457412 RepID=UPI003FD5161F